MEELIIKFKDKETLQGFMVWLSDMGGEDDYLECANYNEDHKFAIKLEYDFQNNIINAK